VGQLGLWVQSFSRTKAPTAGLTTKAQAAASSVALPSNPSDEPRISSNPRKFRRSLTIAIAVLVTCLIALAGLMAWALNDVPFDRIASGRLDNQIITLTASDGEPIIQRGPYQEVAATRDQFPQHLIDAVLATEDRRFYEHWGIDIFGIIRALGRNVFAGQVREGGSTITQQLLKILYLEPDRTVRRKAQELFLSIWLENRLSKDDILTLYLNNVYLGAGATGIPAAARVYFDKEVGEISIAESAMLAGLIASPSALNPIENLEGARDRAAVVLQAMQAAGYLEESAALQAKANSAQLRPSRPKLGTGTWFADWVMQDAQETSGQFVGSVEVTTTLVPELQTIAEQSVQSVMGATGAAAAPIQAAMVVLAPDGAVLAMVGGLDYSESEFNRALAMRQPGSTFKLFTYYAALKMGATPRTRLDDRALDIDGWSPQNFDGKYSGRVTMAEAFARSLNAATVQLGIEVGLPNIVAAARELGIDAPLRETPSLILGASEVSLVDITGAYASVRAGTAPIQPYGISTFKAPNGRPFAIGPSEKPALSLEDVREPMLGMLQLVVDHGTGQAAQLDRFAAGKTGTSQDYRDAWFIGFDENYTVGVWVGNDDGTPMDQVTGGQLPAQIWHAFMTGSVATLPNDDLIPFSPQAAGDAGTPPQCNIQACSKAYRSFRASDCSFQPYSGPRRICER
tara:strand:+ start:786 stop:2840 length:2055 start_codon:yes stop_codon:yes gene_type:complete